MHKGFYLAAMFSLHLNLFSSPESLARQVQAYLFVGDPASARHQAEEALSLYPDHPLPYEWLIRTLAESGEDARMMTLWEKFYAVFPEKAMDQELLEQMCWGILQKGKKAPGISAQLIGVIGAALARDARALPLLLEGLRHTNAHVRLVSVELAALYGDFCFKEELRRLFKEEKVLEVRLQVMRAFGKLHMEEFLPELMNLVGSSKSSAIEKLAAIEAIVQMRECVDEEELKFLISSKRSGLRQLACEAIVHCDLKEKKELLYPLIFDPQTNVSISALKAWGLLEGEATPAIQKLALEAVDPEVGVVASWIWLIHAPKEAERAYTKWLTHQDPRVRSLAAGSIAVSGKYGVQVAKQWLSEEKDPYVQLNLAVALIGQREECAKACNILKQRLMEQSERWMMSEGRPFPAIEKNTLSHRPGIPNYPELMDQTVRLELFNLLAILDEPGALEAIKSLLLGKQWGVTGLAAEALLGEGDENAIDLVRSLLEDPNQEIRLEAALILATWAHDHSAVPILLAEYPNADRQLQVKILESLGRIGERSVIPFLIERLKEPSLMLRMIAACILLQTLNH